MPLWVFCVSFQVNVGFTWDLNQAYQQRRPARTFVGPNSVSWIPLHFTVEVKMKSNELDKRNGNGNWKFKYIHVCILCRVVLIGVRFSISPIDFYRIFSLCVNMNLGEYFYLLLPQYRNTVRFSHKIFWLTSCNLRNLLCA